MKVVILSVGSVRGALAGAVEAYEERAGHYWKLDLVEVEAGVPGRHPRPERVKAAEAERILAKVPDGMRLIALTRTGKSMGSRALSSLLADHAVHATPGVVFCIGGAFGLGASVLARADRTLSLSSLTLPHEMARLVLAEQLYRAGTILRGEPYHKGA